MIKPKKLQKGDKIAIVSLSRGLLGENFVEHEVKIAIKRLKEYGLEPVFMPNSTMNMEYLEKHPEARASDLKEAFKDDSIKGIINAIGGNDTYKILPYLMEDEEFVNLVNNSPKLFTGFSDTTVNHLMFSKLGLQTFYGPCLLVDLGELDKEMLPYTKTYFEKYFKDEESYLIESSDVWYNERENYDITQIGVSRNKNKETHGYEVLNGSGVIKGKLYGGCIESIYNLMTEKEQKDIIDKYNILPTLDEWKEKVLFLETSEEQIKPEKLEEILLKFKEEGIIKNIKGLIVGKPANEKYYNEYKAIYKKIFKNSDVPILYNLNFGHSLPRCILPYNAEVIVDYDKKIVKINEKIFK